jgi:hypothetical protein
LLNEPSPVDPFGQSWCGSAAEALGAAVGALATALGAADGAAAEALAEAAPPDLSGSFEHPAMVRAARRETTVFVALRIGVESIGGPRRGSIRR